MKFVHKLYEPNSLPWKTWFLSYAGPHSSRMPDSYLSRLVQEELPRYRSLTTVLLGDGASTSFWHDLWLLNTTVDKTFPELFSHCIHHENDVRSVKVIGCSSLRGGGGELGTLKA